MDDLKEYTEWVEEWEDVIVERFVEHCTVFPDSVYESVLDDDYFDAEELWLQNATITEVPDEFIQHMYETWLESAGEE